MKRALWVSIAFLCLGVGGYCARMGSRMYEDMGQRVFLYPDFTTGRAEGCYTGFQLWMGATRVDQFVELESRLRWPLYHLGYLLVFGSAFALWRLLRLGGRIRSLTPALVAWAEHGSPRGDVEALWSRCRAWISRRSGLG